jgi:hypothetical protein
MATIKQLPADLDLAGVDKAIKRAAKSAHTLARQTKTPCYVVKDGKIVDIARRQSQKNKLEMRAAEKKS